MGSRYLKKRLLSPLTDKNKILNINNIIEEMIENNNYKDIEMELNNIPDYYKNHKKISYCIIKPYELYKIIRSYNNVINILNIIKKNKILYKYVKSIEINIKMIEKVIKKFNKKFIINQFRFCKSINDITLSLIKKGVNKENDNIIQELNNIKNYKNEKIIILS
jgi:DNA mismatch repair ATPase MutS